MIARCITCIVLFCCQSVLGQTKENEIFFASKGMWKLPVPKGYMLERKTGQHTSHTASQGVNFLSDSSYPVKAVFEGRVVLMNEYDSVFMVVIQYGDYFMGYANLFNFYFKKGDKISQGDTIGNMAKDLDGIYSLEFLLSTNKKELDAGSWFSYKPLCSDSSSQ